MGANVFFETGYGNTAREAFNSALEDSQYENGHGGYSGTLAEKSTFIVIPFDMDGDVEPMDFAEDLIDEGDRRIDDKWGPAGCLEMKSDREGLRKFLFFGWASS